MLIIFVKEILGTTGESEQPKFVLRLVPKSDLFVKLCLLENAN